MIKVGDKVKILNSAAQMNDKNDYIGSYDLGDIGVVIQISSSGEVVLEGDSPLGGNISHPCVELFEAGPIRHKHADLMIQYANDISVEIEAMVSSPTISSPEWQTVGGPSWNEDSVYRIKPKKTPKELERDQLVIELKDLQSRIAKLNIGIKEEC